MDVAIILTAVVRGEEPRFLRQTVEALMRQGLSGVRSEIFCDGPWKMEEPFCGLPVTAKLDGPSGAARGLWGLFERFLETGGQRLMLFEDDVLPCVNAVHRMRAIDVPEDCALVSHFDMCSTRRIARQEGLLRVELLPRRGVYSSIVGGHQACLVPRQVVAWLVERWNPQRVPPMWHGSDLLMSELLASSPWPRYLLQRPSTFEHLGASYSRLTGSEGASGRSALWFAGESVDALTLAR